MDKTTIRKLTTLHNRVEYILEKFPDTRNSDMDLQIRLCESFYPPLEEPIRNWSDLLRTMHSLPSLDHVARVRRKVIEANKYEKYLPTRPEVAKARKILKTTWEAYTGLKDPTKLNLESNVPIGGEDIANGRF